MGNKNFPMVEPIINSVTRIDSLTIKLHNFNYEEDWPKLGDDLRDYLLDMTEHYHYGDAIALGCKIRNPIGFPPFRWKIIKGEIDTTQIVIKFNPTEYERYLNSEWEEQYCNDVIDYIDDYYTKIKGRVNND